MLRLVFISLFGLVLGGCAVVNSKNPKFSGSHTPEPSGAVAQVRHIIGAPGTSMPPAVTVSFTGGNVPQE